MNNINVDKFSNLKQLLYALQSNVMKKYSFGIIHENTNKYSSQVLTNFIKQIDPGIKLVIYKDRSDLIQKTLT
jgi:ribosomal protein S20